MRLIFNVCGKLHSQNYMKEGNELNQQQMRVPSYPVHLILWAFILSAYSIDFQVVQCIASSNPFRCWSLLLSLWLWFPVDVPVACRKSCRLIGCSKLSPVWVNGKRLKGLVMVEGGGGREGDTRRQADKERIMRHDIPLLRTDIELYARLLCHYK